MNLIVCTTPLQILIAEKIIELHPNEVFFGVLLAPVINEKYRYYYSVLKDKCEETILLENTELVNKKIFSWLKAYFQLKKELNHKDFEKIFIASINDYIIHSTIDMFNTSQIYTFDDGIANIFPSSIYFHQSMGVKARILRKLLGIKTDMNSLKAKIQLHYTIYPDMQNIISNIRPISLVKQIKEVSTPQKTVKLLLGQIVFKDVKENVKLMKKVVKQFGIDFYLPHPHETAIVPNVEYIRTPLIFEDYFSQNLADKNCHIYHFFSSGVLNIGKHKNVKITSLTSSQLKGQIYSEIETLFDSFDFVTIKIKKG